MRLLSEITEIPTGAIARRFDMGGHVVQVFTTSAEASALLTDTFYPEGMFGVKELLGHDVPADVAVADRTWPASQIHDLLRDVAGSAAEGRYELTRNYYLPRFDMQAQSLFVLEDVNCDETAALLRSDGTLTIVRPDSALGDRWLTRIVRDMATRYAKARGSLILHSSAFVYNDGAYLVIGDSGAGKSTTAIALARLMSPAAWMGNDRMHLERQGSQYRVTACPLPLAVNKGSLDVIGVNDFESWDLHAGQPRPGSDWNKFMGEDKLKMSSMEVERYLGVRVMPEAVLAGIIFPQVSLNKPYAAELATPEYAATVIARNCLSVDDNLYGENWLGVVGESCTEPPSIDTFLAEIAGLPLLRCSVGSSADMSKLADDVRRITTSRGFNRPYARLASLPQQRSGLDSPRIAPRSDLTSGGMAPLGPTGVGQGELCDELSE